MKRRRGEGGGEDRSEFIEETVNFHILLGLPTNMNYCVSRGGKSKYTWGFKNIIEDFTFFKDAKLIPKQ